MTTVRVQNSFDLLNTQLEEFARSLRTKNSLELINSNEYNSLLFVQSFFDNYELRLQYLKNDKDKYIFLSFEDISDFALIDQVIFEKFRKLFSIQINDLASLGNFLESQDQYLVLMTTSSNQNEIRYLLSYAYLLKNHVIFIFATNYRQNLFDKQLTLNFSEAFLNFYINEELLKFGLNIEYTPKIFQEINGDLSLINSSIKRILKDEIQLELPIFEIQNNFQIPQKLEDEAKLEFPDRKISSNEVRAEMVLQDQNELESFAKQEVEPAENVQSSDEEIKPWFKVQESKKQIKPKDLTEFKSDYLNLTAREESIYEALVDKKFITRQELAVLAWGEEGKEAKDDAIDQVISRLRRKFVKAGFSKEYITSKKGEGVELIQ